MAKHKTAETPARLEKIEGRLLRLEEMLYDALFSSTPDKALRARWKEKRTEARETVVGPWRFLVRRLHPWRTQLYLKGRNLTARQLVGSIKANQWEDEKAAENYHLPIDAIREALAYVEQHRELLATEAEIEQLMRKRQGVARVPQPVS